MAVNLKRRLEQRDKVLIAARRCFVRHGFHATGMVEIAKACRMSVGNIYHYFSHKNAIVHAITDEIRSRMLPVLKPLEDHTNPLEGLVQVMLISLREICSGSNARLWMEILAEAPRNKAIRNICEAFDRDFHSLLERLIQRAVQIGQLPQDTDLEATYFWLGALLDGAIAGLSTRPDADLTRTEETLAKNLRRFLRVGGA
jgi:AcrR family transcriptional regulator